MTTRDPGWECCCLSLVLATASGCGIGSYCCIPNKQRGSFSSSCLIRWSLYEWRKIKSVWDRARCEGSCWASPAGDVTSRACEEPREGDKERIHGFRGIKPLQFQFQHSAKSSQLYKLKGCRDLTLSGLGNSKGDRSAVVLRRDVQYSDRKIPNCVVINREAWNWDSSQPPAFCWSEKPMIGNT